MSIQESGTQPASHYTPFEKTASRWAKSAHFSAVMPNMPNYSQARESFSWKTVESRLDLPKSNGINKASICIDSHAPEVMHRTALIWKGNQGEEERYTFADLKEKTNQFANVLTELGIQKGDRVFIFLERIPELYIALFGALKVGAVVGPLFSAFGPEAIRDRLQDSGAKLLVTSPALKERVDGIRHELPALEKVILVDKRHEKTGEALATHELCYETLMQNASSTFTVPYTDPNDFSIIHYTSGTTGKPKGAVHRHLAVVAQYETARCVLDLKPESDLYWCTADPGWVTGTSYGMFGPWSLGCTILVYEGGFKAETWYQLIQDYKVTVWYTAPTAIRMLMKAGDEVVGQFDLSSLRYLTSVGEPLNPEAIV